MEELMQNISAGEMGQRFRELFKHVAIGMVVYKTDGIFLEVNKPFCKLTGYSSKELLSMSFKDITHPEDLSNDLEKVQLTLEGKINDYEIHKKYIRKDGFTIWVHLTVSLIRDENKSPVCFVGTIEDITEQKKTEEISRLSEEKFHKLFQSSHDAITLTRQSDRIITEINESACIITGYKRHELIGQSILSLKFWANETELNEYSRLLRKDKRVYNFEAKFRIKSGEIKTGLVSGEVIQLQDGIYVLGIIRDITERKQAEAILAMERTLLRTLIDHIPSGIFVKNNKYKKIIINPEHSKEVRGHLKVLGLDPEIELLNTTDFDVFPKKLAEKFFIDDQKVILEGQSIINKVEVGIDPDGKKNWFLVSKVPLYDKNGKITAMVGVTTDITSQKEIEQKLIKAKERAEESDRLKSIFLANMSHEVRTPLNAILGFSGLLDDPDLTRQKRKHYIDIIRNSGNRLIQLIDDVIDVSKIEAKQLSVNLQEHRIYDIVKQCIQTFNNSEVLLRKPELNLKLNFPEKLKSAVTLTDDVRLQQVLDNLIMNAIKYTEKGYVEAGAKIMARNHKKYIEFYIKDTGSGIPEEKHDLVFERFRQAEENSYHEGTGLGLSISKGIAQLLGGEIWFDSKMNEGSTFYFTIPYTMEKNESAMKQEKEHNSYKN